MEQMMSMPATPPNMPTTVPRRSAGKAEVRRVKLSGVTMEAPIPSRMRPLMSATASGDRAQSVLLYDKYRYPEKS